MSLLSSLTNRIFGAMALLTVASIGAATYYATSAVTAQAEGELRRGLSEAETLVEEYRRLLFEHFTREARLVADLPLVKAAVETNDPPTMRPIAETLQQQLGADLLVVRNRRGGVLAHVGPEDETEILQQVSTPIAIGRDLPEVLGTLTVGFSLDARAAARFRELTSSEIAFGSGGRIRTSTLPRDVWPLVAPLLDRNGITPSLQIGEQDYIAATRRLADSRAPDEQAGTRAIILRSRTDRLQFLSGVHRRVLLVAIAAVLFATLASYAVARTVTRPLETVTDAMREMASTGDLTRRITLHSGAPWDDEDTRLLVSTFNTMTDSIARFQREVAQRERLSSLGRFSTVIAHEIRNPLMIIRTALRRLRADHVSAETLKLTIADIDEEVTRLNRIVSEVLDFARPLRFDLVPADLNVICADAAGAAMAGTEGPDVKLDLAPDVPPLVTDVERLRQALVNVLANARQAVVAGREPAAPVVLRTEAGSDGHLLIRVHDRGAGIAAEDLPRVFDPFFTTHRTGTGLGLALTRNIIEGLGGSIVVSSRRDEGTEVEIRLPHAASR